MELKKELTIPANEPATKTVELYTRWEHGQHRVSVSEKQLPGRRRIQRRYTLHGDREVEFASTSAFLKHVTGGKIKNLSHDRYFLLDGRRHEIVGTTPAGILEVGRAPLVVIRRPPIRYGIDLENRGSEIKKILYKCFGQKITRQGYDHEEILQEVYVKIAKANAGDHPYNPQKSSFGHYVYMACNSLLMNYGKKERRRSSKIWVGGVHDGGAAIESGVVAVDKRGIRDGGVDTEIMVRGIKDRLGGNELAGQILDLLADGCPRREIARELGVEARKVSAALKLIQDRAKRISQDW